VSDLSRILATQEIALTTFIPSFPISCVSFTVEPETQWVVQHTAAKVVKILKKFIEEGLAEVDGKYAKVRLIYF
jgi:hypothetical protein